jgi:hypothetical protein
VTIVSTVVGWAFWSADLGPDSNGAAAATTVNQGNTPSAAVTGSTATVTWVGSTLASGQAVTGYLVQRFAAGTLELQPALGTCAGTVTATTCTESSVPEGRWVYAITPRIGTHWMGTPSAKSSVVVVDTVGPSSTIELSSVSGGAYRSGTTVYYRGVDAGSFRLTDTVADSGSGPASSTTAALTGTAPGWSHNPATVSTPAGGPYVSNPFTWTAGTTSAPGETVTSRDASGNATTTALTFVNDSSAPTGSTVTYPALSSGSSVTVTFTTGTDAGSGIESRQLQRAHASYVDGACETFSTFLPVGPADPSSPYTDSQVGNASCYKYRYVVTDRLGNREFATSAVTAVADYSATVAATPGLVSHWRFGEAPVSSDSFTDSPRNLYTHSGELGETWSQTVGTNMAVITPAGRVRRSGDGYVLDFVSAVPPNADYAVEIDVHYAGLLAQDSAGVMGRYSVATGVLYYATYETRDGSWNLYEYRNGAAVLMGEVTNRPLAVGQTARLRLEMAGGLIQMYVDETLLVSVADATPITGVGRAGLWNAGTAGLPVQTDTAGLHMDNFAVRPLRAVDRVGSNPGRYVAGALPGVAGALAGDVDTATRFDGSNDYMQVNPATGIPVGSAARSVELWFKTTSTTRQVLFEYGALAPGGKFGLWLDAGSTSMTAWGWGSDNLFPLTASVTDGTWHHVVQTYDGATMTLYVDGVALPAQTAVRTTTMGSTGLGVGAVGQPGDAGSGGYFTGTLDEVSLYTTALGPTTAIQHYQLGTTSSANSTGPVGGSVQATGLTGIGSRYSASTTVTLALAKGTDSDGVAATGARLLRQSAPLTSSDYINGGCGTWSAYSLVSTDPGPSTTDVAATGSCYRYRYVVADTLERATTYGSGVVKVDTTAPTAPATTFIAGYGASQTGSTIYYRSSQDWGYFGVYLTSSDPQSGVPEFSFPEFGTNWSQKPGGFGLMYYVWAGATSSPGTQQFRAVNSAAAPSGNTSYTLAIDNAAPTTGTVTYVDGATTSTSVSVAFTTGTDAGSGVGTRLLQRAVAPLTGDTCGTFGAFTTVTGGTNPTSPLVNTVTVGSCYKYQYVVQDKVVNETIATSTSVVKVVAPYFTQVKATTGLANYFRLGESPAALLSSDSFTGASQASLTRAGT